MYIRDGFVHIQVNILILLTYFYFKGTITDFFISDAGPGFGSNSSLLGMFEHYFVMLFNSVHILFSAVWWSLRYCNLKKGFSEIALELYVEDF